MNGLFFGFLVGFLMFPWFGPVGILLGAVVGVLADVTAGRRASGAFGSETAELVLRLFALWGKISGHSGALGQSQALFLQSLMANQLRLGPSLARDSMATFDESWKAATQAPWTELLSDVSSLSKEIYEDFFLDRQTLIWIYATCRRLAGLGTIRPGIVELLDTVARNFFIFEEVGSAGTEGPGRSDERQYDQTWKDFRPASAAGPEAYANLGLTPEASVEDIKKAYRTLARQFHPDTRSHLPDDHPDKKKAADRFLQVQQAYERIRKARNF